MRLHSALDIQKKFTQSNIQTYQTAVIYFFCSGQLAILLRNVHFFIFAMYTLQPVARQRKGQYYMFFFSVPETIQRYVPTALHCL